VRCTVPSAAPTAQPPINLMSSMDPDLLNAHARPAEAAEPHAPRGGPPDVDKRGSTDCPLRRDHSRPARLPWRAPVRRRRRASAPARQRRANARRRARPLPRSAPTRAARAALAVTNWRRNPSQTGDGTISVAPARLGERPRVADGEPQCQRGGGVTAPVAALSPSARRPRSAGSYNLATGHHPPPLLASASARAPLTASLSVSAATA